MIFFQNNQKIIKGEVTAFFINEGLHFRPSNKSLSNKEVAKVQFYLNNLRTKKLKEKIIAFDFSEKNKFLFVVVKKDILPNNFEELGAIFLDFIKKNKIEKINLFADSLNFFKNYNENNNLILKFIHGLNLKAYSFNKYKTKNNNSFNYNIKINSFKNQYFRPLSEVSKSLEYPLENFGNQ